MFSEIQNGRHGSTSHFLWTQLFKFYYHIPHDLGMCRGFFQCLTEIQNGVRGWTQKLI